MAWDGMRWHDTRVRLLSRAVGELTALTVDELMLATGLESLDTANPLVAQDYPDSTGTPSFRITGVAFDVRVVYEGSISRFASNRPPKAQARAARNLPQSPTIRMMTSH